MNRINSIVAAFAVLLACVVASSANPSITRAVPKPDQPHMETARTALANAQTELKVAEENKGGHRANALKLVGEAIGEVDKGIDYARKHAHPIVTSPGDQPHMQAALDYLKTAQAELKLADADKGGHRANALRLVGEAITETNKGIRYAR